MRVQGRCTALLLLAALLCSAAGSAQAGGTEWPGGRRRGLGEEAPSPAAALQPVSAVPLTQEGMAGVPGRRSACQLSGCTAPAAAAAAKHAAVPGMGAPSPGCCQLVPCCRRTPQTA